MHLPLQLYTTEWIARHKPWKKFTKKQNIQFFQLCTPAVSVASPLHWIIYVVNNNLKKSCLLHLWEIHNSNLTFLGFSRLENLAGLLKEVWMKTQGPTVFYKTNIRAITNEKVWGHRGQKVWRTRYLSQSEGPSLQFFSGQADTVQCPVQIKQKVLNNNFAAMVE